MDESKKNANPQVCSVAVRIPSAMSMDALDAPWGAARLVEVILRVLRSIQNNMVL